MPNTLQDFLEVADGAGNLLAHARLLLRLAHLYEQIAPAHLRQASKIANYKAGLIVIHATNSAVATKLRHLATTLAEGFSQRGIECNGVQVKVQAPETPAQSRTSTSRPLTAESSCTLEELRDALPESALREAVSALIDRSARAE